MKQYTDYKDSGIEWIREIPEGWNIKKFGYLFSFGRGLSITKEDLKDEGIPCVSYGEIHSKYGFEVNPAIHNLKCVDESYLVTSEKSLLSFGDFVFADTSEDVDGSGNFTYLNSNIPVFAGYHTIITKLIDINNHIRYLAYLFDSDAFRAQIQSKVYGIKVYSITQAILKTTKVVLPPIEEQQTIADYLDRKTIAIVKLIANKQKLIDLLKEKRHTIINETVTKGLDKNTITKDSGSEMIGSIPKDWITGKLKYYSYAIGDGLHGTPTYNDDGEYYFINGNNLGELKILIKENTNKLSFEEYQKYKVDLNENSILISLNGTIGNISFYNGENIVLSKSAGYISLKPNINKKYFYYYLKSELVSLIFELSFAGTTIKNLSLETLRNLLVIYPPLQTQKEIADYLDECTTQIDKLITDISEQIEKLKEYRQSIISEAVTGKVAI